MATPIEIAINRQADLKAELAELDTFIRVYYRLNCGMSVQKDSPANPNYSMLPPYIETGKLANALEIWSDIFRRLLEEAGRPLKRGELVERIKQRTDTPPLKGNDHPKYVGTMLWRGRRRFINIPGHGYWLIEKDYEPALYKPEREVAEEPGAAETISDE